MAQADAGTRMMHLADRALDWLNEYVFVLSTVIQLAVAAGLYLGLRLWVGRVERLLLERAEALRASGSLVAYRLARSGIKSIRPALLAVLLTAAGEVCRRFHYPDHLLGTLSALAVAWVAVKLLTAFVSNRFWARTAAFVVWAIAALSILGVLDEVSAFLGGIGMHFGKTYVSVLLVLKGVLLLALLMQLAAIAIQFFQDRIATVQQLSPSVQVLFVKGVKFGLYAVVFLVAISAVGVDLTSLAVVGGAVGVGIGFGLQKVFSNLVSGVILLLDKSIKPGDTIEIVGGVFGKITSLNARYASVLTRDGKEYLIPNEMLITNEVINWSFGDTNVRLKIPVGVSYGADVELAMRLMLQAAEASERILKDPAPVVRLIGFGDSSVDLELRVWIADPMEGVKNVEGPINEAIWKLFHEHDVEIPFPQRDLHIKSMPPVRLARDDAATESAEGGGGTE